MEIDNDEINSFYGIVFFFFFYKIGSIDSFSNDKIDNRLVCFRRKFASLINRYICQIYFVTNSVAVLATSRT